MFLIRKPPFAQLYENFKNSSSLQENLLILKPRERSLLRKLDLFRQGALSLNTFHYLIDLYAQTSLALEFAQSDEFALYLKSGFSFWTFDDEEPIYPEQGFLTPDRLLAIDFHANYEHADALKIIIEKLYEELGVEKAYAYLFKILSEDYTSFEEEIYQKATKDLEEVGFPSYEKSLELKSNFRTKKYVDFYVKEKIKNQNLGQNALMQGLSDERKNFLKKNLYEVFSEFLVLQGYYSSLDEQEKNFLNFIQKGLEYLKNFVAFPLIHLDFRDFFIIGRSLNLLEEKEKEKLKDSFYGEVFQEFIYKDSKILIKYQPLIKTLKEFTENHLESSYYNSSLINFDLCFTTLFIQWTLNKSFQKNKLGISIKELKDFVKKFMIKKNHLYYFKDKNSLVEKFIQEQDLTHADFLKDLLEKEFEGQDFLSYTEKDYPYVGGVLLLKNGSH